METVNQFLARGGKITQIPEGERAKQIKVDPMLRRCRCGCKGNYMEHTMRLAKPVQVT